MVRPRRAVSRVAAVLAACALVAVPAAAQEDEESLVFHGFVSQGGMWSTANNYLAQSDRGSVEFFEAAINLSRPLSERLRVAAQLFARDLGPLGDYRATFDWAFLDYLHADWLGLRVGRFKMPFGLYNEFSDYDPGRLQILLPQSIYPIVFREFLLAATGAEVYGYMVLEHGGALDYHLYGGTLFIQPEDLGISRDSVLEVPYTIGGRLLWEPPIDGLRVGGSVLALRLDSDIEVAGTPVTTSLPAVLWTASADYTLGALLLAAEYSRWRTEIRSGDPTVLPNRVTVSERFYVSSAYRFSPLVQAGVYYSALYPNVETRSARQNQQHDIAATVRFDLTPNWLLKLEGHFLRGTAALSPALNDDRPRSELADTWGLLLAKTTVYF